MLFYGTRRKEELLACRKLAGIERFVRKNNVSPSTKINRIRIYFHVFNQISSVTINRNQTIIHKIYFLLQKSHQHGNKCLKEQEIPIT